MAVIQKGFGDELKRMIASSQYLLANHPFVEGIEKGSLSAAQLKGWALQDSHYRRAVPRLAMIRYLRCSDPRIQRELAGVVAEEAEGSVTGSSGHYELFLRLAERLGASREEVETSRPLAGPAAHIYWAELIAWTLPWFVAMSAQLAGEGQFPDAAEKLHAGFKRNYDLSDHDLAFFSVHDEADEEHGELAEEIASRYLVTAELQEQAQAVVQRKLELQWDMWSAYQAY